MHVLFSLETAAGNSVPQLVSFHLGSTCGSTHYFFSCLVSDTLRSPPSTFTIRSSSQCRSEVKKSSLIEEWHQRIKGSPSDLKDSMQLFKMANLYTGLLRLTPAYWLALYRQVDGTRT